MKEASPHILWGTVTIGHPLRSECYVVYEEIELLCCFVVVGRGTLYTTNVGEMNYYCNRCVCVGVLITTPIAARKYLIVLW